MKADSLQITDNRLIAYLDRNNIEYHIDTNPSEEKIDRIKKAIARKKELLGDAVKTYKRVFLGE